MCIESMMQNADGAIRMDIASGLKLYDELIAVHPCHHPAYKFRGAWKIEQGRIIKNIPYLNEGIADIEVAIVLCGLKDGKESKNYKDLCINLERANYELQKVVEHKTKIFQYTN